MRKIYILLFLALGANVKNFASNQNQGEQITILSKDKSKISVLYVTEQKKIISKRKYKIIKTYENVCDYAVSKEASRHINDTLAAQLVVNNTGIMPLKDSIVYPWMHLFGREVHFKGGFNVSEDNIDYYLLIPCDSEKELAENDLFKLGFFISLLLTVLCLLIRYLFPRIPKQIFPIFLYLALVFFLVLSGYSADYSIYGLTFIVTIFFIPSLFIIFLSFNKRERKNKLEKKGYNFKNRIPWEKNTFFVINKNIKTIL